MNFPCSQADERLLNDDKWLHGFTAPKLPLLTKEEDHSMSLFLLTHGGLCRLLRGALCAVQAAYIRSSERVSKLL